MNSEQMQAVIDDIKHPDFDYYVIRERDVHYLQISFWTYAGTQRGRKWLLSTHMTESEIVQTALKAALTAQEHEIRETFTYKGVDIFNPHINVNDLINVRVNRPKALRATS